MKKLSFILLFCLFPLAFVSALELQYAGSKENLPQWRNPEVSKVAPTTGGHLDVDRDNILGTAGYLVFAPESGKKRSPAPSYLSHLFYAHIPAWVQSVESLSVGAELVSLPNYAKIDHPKNGNKPLQSGALVTKSKEPRQDIPALRIILGSSCPPLIRLGLMLDNLDNPVYNAATIKVVSGDKELGPLATSLSAQKANNLPDWYFVDVINAQPGESIEIKLTSQNTLATLGALTFDVSQDVNAAKAATLPQVTNAGDASPTDSGPEKPMKYYAQFVHPGRYLKDYYVYKDERTYHLFYNIGMAGPKQHWQQPGNEEMFGHATSKDLKNWEIHPGVIITQPLTWEEATVSAPSIIKRNGRYWMAYTGFDRHATQQIGIAVSDDLFHWERLKENPVYQGPSWTIWEAGKWADCRDGDIVEWQGEVLMFTTVINKSRQGYLAVARSKDLINWEDLGEKRSIAVGFHPGESPRAFVYNGKMYVFATSGKGRKLWISEDPLSGNWRELPFAFPGGGLWSGWEVVEGPEGQTVFSAFQWKSHGNHIRFWEVKWEGDLPVLQN